MFKDLALSRDLVVDFHNKFANDPIDVMPLSVNVLQYSSWPIARRKEGELEIGLPVDVGLVNAILFAKNRSKNLDANHLGQVPRLL